MAKHPQTIRRLLQTIGLSAFDHFVGLMLKWLKQMFPYILMLSSILHHFYTP